MFINIYSMTWKPINLMIFTNSWYDVRCLKYFENNNVSDIYVSTRLLSFNERSFFVIDILYYYFIK